MGDPIRAPGHNVFFDTEFVEDGRTIMPISAGFVREDGAELYVEYHFDRKKAEAHEWVNENVLPHLHGEPLMRREIRRRIEEFCGLQPRFWAWFGAYDWLVLAQTHGTMKQLPYHWPMFCMDLRQSYTECPHHVALPPKPKDAHHALADARWNLQLFRILYPHGFPPQR